MTPTEALAALETAVSNALSAATEGGDYTRAPEPSDEPGSPYVKHIAASLLAAGVGFPDADARPDTATLEWLVDCAIRHEHITASRGAEILGISLREMAIGGREREGGHYAKAEG